MSADSSEQHGGAAMPMEYKRMTGGALGMRSFLYRRANLVLMGFMLLGARASAQAPTNPLPVQAPSPAAVEILSSLPKPPDEPRSLFAPPVAEQAPHAIVPDHYFQEDPLLDLPQLPALGWFASAEA